MLLDYRILVVEDDRVIADVIASQLSRWGLDVKLVTGCWRSFMNMTRSWC